MRAINNIPYTPEKEEKTIYMWRDIERRAKKHGLPVPKTPVPYPLQEFDLANKIGLVANKEGWFLEYFRETYKVWFLEGKEAGSERNLEETFKNLEKKNIRKSPKTALKKPLMGLQESSQNHQKIHTKNKHISLKAPII